MARYSKGDRPWTQTFNRIDWFIAQGNCLYPLKYTYALAMNIPPAEFTTDQMKSAMGHLRLTYHSLKAQKDIEISFYAQVKSSLADDVGRIERLRTAPTQPKVTYSYQLVFQRNPDVVAQVLRRAAGKCEGCGQPAPFLRICDQTPYLEVHHIVFLSAGGEDSVRNAEALCPNCHRRKHHGNDSSPQRT